MNPQFRLIAPLLLIGKRWLLLQHLGLIMLMLLMDWVSNIKPESTLGLTAWNPVPAIAILAFSIGRSFFFSFLLGLMLSDGLVHGSGFQLLPAFTVALVNAISYYAARMALSTWVPGFIRFDSFASLASGLAIFLFSALLNAALSVTVLWAFGKLDVTTLGNALANLAIGDWVGIVVFYPLLAMLRNPVRRNAYLRLLRTPNFLMPSALMLAIICLLASFPVSNPLRYSYFILLPLAWIAVRDGITGVSLASFMAQLSLIAAYASRNSPNVVVLEVQTLMSVIALIALTMGVAIEEKARTDRKLRDNQRAATLGQMASVVTHEISQPLTSMGTYALVLRHILSRHGAGIPEEGMQVLKSLIAESARVRDIIRRVKYLYLEGTVVTQPYDLKAVVLGIIGTETVRAKAQGVNMQFNSTSSRINNSGDEVQISLALRNLLANAVSAAAAGSEKWTRIDLWTDVEQVYVDFSDSGNWLDEDAIDSIFDLGYSRTPGGMGVGLFLARSIIEAHQGQLLAIPYSSLKFRVILPISTHSQPLSDN